MRLSIALLLGALAYGSSSPATAATLRCEGKLVRPGHYLAEVMVRCGEPLVATAPVQQVESRFDPVAQVSYLTTRTVQQVIYDPGPGRFYRVLEFHDGVLARIRRGERSP